MIFPKTTFYIGTDGQTVGRTDGRTDGQSDGHPVGRAAEWTDNRTDGRPRAPQFPHELPMSLQHSRANTTTFFERSIEPYITKS